VICYNDNNRAINLKTLAGNPFIITIKGEKKIWGKIKAVISEISR